ncbi:MAG: IclR family transcriptional regulator [Acidimicrobiia bacterium]
MSRSAATTRARGSSGPKLLDRTFAILSVFTDEAPEWTTTEAAHARDLPVPTVHRILSALEKHGYVTRDGATKRFRLGTAALELGRLARATIDVQSVSVPILQSLAAETGETALLTALNRDRSGSVCLDRVESSHDLRLSLAPGRQMQLHAGASQKALLAYMEESEIESVVGGVLTPLCRATITDGKRLREELAKIRERGWATSYEETNLGVWGIAVTLLDPDGGVVAAVGLAGPRIRVPKNRVGNVLETLQDGAAEIASRLAIRTSTQLALESRRHG